MAKSFSKYVYWLKSWIACNKSTPFLLTVFRTWVYLCWSCFHASNVILKIPFGDQSFTIKREDFLKLDAFREELKIGEDHEFVWRCKRHGIPIRQMAASVSTSARKYDDRGWLKTTAQHLYLTAKQIAQFR